MLQLLSRCTNTLIHMQRAPFCDSSFCVLRFEFSLKTAAGFFGGVSEDTKPGRGRGKRPIKINTVALHSFTVKQQLHKTGNKYCLCSRGKRPAARGPVNPRRPANPHRLEGRKAPKPFWCRRSSAASQNVVFILIYDSNSQPG